jgi:nitrous oxidase accessory protein NosD
MAGGVCIRNASTNIRKTNNSTTNKFQTKYIKRRKKNTTPDFQGQLSTQSSADRGGAREHT